MQTPFYHAPLNLSGLSLERWVDGPSGLLAKGKTPGFRPMEPGKRGNRTTGWQLARWRPR